MTDLDPWWNRLTEDDRTLFTDHCDDTWLPAEVAQRAIATGQPVPATGWTNSSSGYTFTWPSWVQEFLRGKAAERAV